MMKKLLACMLLWLLLPLSAVADDSGQWIEVPELVRPGKLVRFVFSSPAATEAEAAVYQGNEWVTDVFSLRQVEAGDTSFYWGGTDGTGASLPAGNYTLRLTTAEGTAEAPLTVGDEAPMILSLDADDTAGSTGWTARVRVNMAGQITLSVNADSGEEVLVTQAVEAGEGELVWDGTIQGSMVSSGVYELTLRFVDETGFSATPESLEVEVVRPSLATDVVYHKPNENSAVKCDHDVCFWQLNMGEMDEEAIWQVLTQPVTVLKGGQREQVKVRKEPDANCTDYVGEVTCASQGVHILERGEEWTLIEAYSSSASGSKVKVWALPFQGYVKTSLLEEKEVDQEYGIVIDKLQQRLYVFKEGKLFTTLMCSTGFPTADAPYNETPAGEFLIVSWTGGFYSGNLYCDLALRINSGILLHEVPCIITTAADGTEERNYYNCELYLGEKASHGCIRIQRRLSPEGVNMRWLWDNLNRKVNTKVIIWDEVGRVLGYPDDDVLLYYNPDGGKNYHSSPYCAEVNQKYWPLTAFTYDQLDEAPYSKLTRCEACAPQLRVEEIDELNAKNTR